MTEPNFEGHPGRECGEHRTVGARAWCHECSEWCYPGDGGCKGCELPGLRAEIERLQGIERLARRAVDSVISYRGDIVAWAELEQAVIR